MAFRSCVQRFDLGLQLSNAVPERHACLDRVTPACGPRGYCAQYVLIFATPPAQGSWQFRPQWLTLMGMSRALMTCPVRARFSSALGLALLLTATAAAQEAANPPPAALAPDQAPLVSTKPAPALPTPPEIIGAIGRIIDRSVTSVGEGVKGAGQTLGAGVRGAGETLGGASSAAGDLAKGMTDAAGTVARIPLGNVVSGFERCTIAPNGAPDCAPASDALCRTKGFARGSSVDITSARKCPAAVWLQGRQPTEAECVNETFVSKAVCQ